MKTTPVISIKLVETSESTKLKMSEIVLSTVHITSELSVSDEQTVQEI